MIKLRRLIQRFALFTSVFSVLLLSGCGESGAQQQIPPTPTSIAGLQQTIQTILTRNHVPGAGIALVAKDHIIWEGGVGEARLATHTPVTENTMFRVGSITKSFVALALLKLQEEGKIDLNAKLATVAPTLPFRNPWEATDPVTVAEVLEHTAGFDDMPVSEVYNLTEPANIDPFVVCELFSNTLVSRWPPGTRMSYSNPDYGVAGYLIWKATGQQFDSYIEGNILQPLGMTASGFTLTDKIYAQLAQGYDGNPPHAVPYLDIYLRPAGDLKSSPAELAKLVQMFLNDGKVGKQPIVSAASIERMEYPETTLAARLGLKEGYGFGNDTDFSGPVVEHGHGGAIVGYLSTYRYMPHQGVGFVALINNDSGGAALRAIDHLLARYLLAGQSLPAPPAASVSPTQLQKFTGYYEDESPRNELTAFLDVLLDGAHVSFSGGRLYLKLGWLGRAKALAPTGGSQFRLADQAAPSMIFLSGPSGREILAYGGFFGERRGEAWPLARFILIELALLAVLSSLFFALWWIPRKLLGKVQGKSGLPMRLMPLLAALSLLAAYLILQWTPIWVLGTYTMPSVSIYLLTWLFSAFSVLALILVLRASGEPANRAVFWHSLVVSIACCGLVIYMAWWRLLGIRLWMR
jgi:CubicO group peptidase (beta-lactamase class C family)